MGEVYVLQFGHVGHVSVGNHDFIQKGLTGIVFGGNDVFALLQVGDGEDAVTCGLAVACFSIKAYRNIIWSSATCEKHFELSFFCRGTAGLCNFNGCKEIFGNAEGKNAFAGIG